MGLNFSGNYTISENGYGKVFAFDILTQGIFDNANGVDIAV